MIDHRHLVLLVFVVGGVRCGLWYIIYPKVGFFGVLDNRCNLYCLLSNSKARLLINIYPFWRAYTPSTRAEEEGHPFF